MRSVIHELRSRCADQAGDESGFATSVRRYLDLFAAPPCSRLGILGAHYLPNWIDLLLIIAFSLIIFYYAVSVAMKSEQIKMNIETEQRQLAATEELNLPGWSASIASRIGAESMSA